MEYLLIFFKSYHFLCVPVIHVMEIPRVHYTQTNNWFGLI